MILEFLKQIEYELYDIHAELFTTPTSNNLLNIKEDLIKLSDILNKIDNEYKEVNKITDRLINLIVLFLRLLSSLMLCLILAGFCNVIVGIFSFITFYYLAYKINKNDKENNENKEIMQLIKKLKDDIEYKQEITEKKIKFLERKNLLETNSISIDTSLYKKDLPLIRKLTNKHHENS